MRAAVTVGTASVVRRVLAATTMVIVAGCVLVGAFSVESERATADAGARTLPHDPGGPPIFTIPQVPEGFIRFAAAQIPEQESVEYVAPGLNLCRLSGTAHRYFGVLYWMQYRLAPRPTACGGRWVVYIGVPVPSRVPASGRWSDSFAVALVTP